MDIAIKDVMRYLSVGMILLSMEASSTKIDLSLGMKLLFGAAAIDYELKGFSDPNHRLFIISDVGGGYFIRDGLVVGASLPVSISVGRIKTGAFGLRAFGTYFFDIDSIALPYLGIGATPGYRHGDRTFTLSSGIDAGVLISLSKSVALDLGLRPELFFKLYPSQDWRISLPAGFLGLRATFL